MSLTTNMKVWKILSVIFIVMTVILAVLFYLWNISITFALGFTLIIISERLIRDYRRRFKKYGISGWKTKVIGYSILLFWTLVIIYSMSSSIQEFGMIFDKIRAEDDALRTMYTTEVKPYVPEFLQKIMDNLFLNENTIASLQKWLTGELSNVLSSVSSIILNSVLIIPIMFYLYFKRKEEIMNNIYDMVPEKFHDSFTRATKDINRKLNDFFGAKIVESIIVGSICCFGFYVAGLKGWLVLGAFAGIMNLIPYLGPMIGALPALVLGFIDEPVVAMYVLIIVIIAQLVDNLYLIPFMIADKVKIEPIVGIVLILTGAKLFSIMGMIFAVPIYLVYKTILREAYIELVKLYD